jgi:hypothetical protein
MISRTAAGVPLMLVSETGHARPPQLGSLDPIARFTSGRPDRSGSSRGQLA